MVANRSQVYNPAITIQSSDISKIQKMSVCTAVAQHIQHHICTKAKQQDNRDTETPFSGC